MKLSDYELSVKIAASFLVLILVVFIGSATLLLRLNALESGLSPELRASLTMSKALLVGMNILWAAVLIYIAYWIIQQVSKPLHQAASYASKVAQGDLTQRLHTNGRADEIGWLFAEMKNMTQSLGTLASAVRTRVNAVSQVVGEIRDATERRTEQQSSVLQSTAATIKQLSVAVNLNSDNAKKAQQVAGRAAGASVDSREVVQRVVSTMRDISNDSKQIESIVGVLDGIAFQTNILALNAAVEAARAGDRGRGFAVVATEVRSLAQRSAESSKEVRGLVQRSTQQVMAGTRLVDEAGQALAMTVREIESVANIARDILSASSEQVVGIDQLNHAIAQIDQVSGDNTALAQETKAAVHRVHEQAQELVEIIDRFKLDHSTVASRTFLEQPRRAPFEPDAGDSALPRLTRY